MPGDQGWGGSQLEGRPPSMGVGVRVAVRAHSLGVWAKMMIAQPLPEGKGWD